MGLCKYSLTVRPGFNLTEGFIVGEAGDAHVLFTDGDGEDIFNFFRANSNEIRTGELYRQVSSLLSLDAEPPIPAMVSDASFPAKSEEASSSSEAVAA